MTAVPNDNIQMTFGGPFPGAIAASRAAEKAGFSVDLERPPWPAEAQTTAFLRLTDVTLSPDDEWSQRTMAKAQALMEPFGFELRACGPMPTGRAYRLS